MYTKTLKKSVLHMLALQYTALYCAAEGGHAECLELLLAAACIDRNQANNDGDTPLNMAAVNGHAECLKLLLAAPWIDVNKADDDGVTPLYCAEEGGHAECGRRARIEPRPQCAPRRRACEAIAPGALSSPGILLGCLTRPLTLASLHATKPPN